MTLQNTTLSRHYDFYCTSKTFEVAIPIASVTAQYEKALILRIYGVMETLTVNVRIYSFSDDLVRMPCLDGVSQLAVVPT